MSIKVLLIDDDARWRELIVHHITTEWSDALIRQRDPAVEGPLPREFAAAAFDAVLLDHDLAGQSGLDWLAEFTQRPAFPPVLFLTPNEDEATVLPALRAGAEACVGKQKIDHRRFIGTLREATPSANANSPCGGVLRRPSSSIDSAA